MGMGLGAQWHHMDEQKRWNSRCFNAIEFRFILALFSFCDFLGSVNQFPSPIDPLGIVTALNFMVQKGNGGAGNVLWRFVQVELGFMQV